MNAEIPNRFYRVSLKALILDETHTKFLLVQENDGKWELPGGGIDWEESTESCLRREIQEEMGLTVLAIKSTPSYFLTRKAQSSEIYVAQVLYEVTLEHLNFVASDECISIKFVTPDEVEDLDAYSTVQMFAKMFDPLNHVT